MKSYHHLTQAQRYQIASYLQLGISQAEIARHLKVHKSNINRELQRNTFDGVYEPAKAQEEYVKRRLRCRKPFKLIGALLNTMLTKLKQYWSPEQISGWLKKEGKASISHECIYQYLEREKTNGGKFYKFLRHSNRKRRKRFAKERRGKIPNRISIEQRPAHIGERTEIGHWERDSIIGRYHQAGLAVHVERKICLVSIRRLVRKTAENFSGITMAVMQSLPVACNSITNDNGHEFAGHQMTTKVLNADIYFSHPYSSWECGTVENINGLIRQFFPKKTDFSKISDQEIEMVELLLNSRPRKKLGYISPLEALSLELH